MDVVYSTHREMRNAYKIRLEVLKEREHEENLGIDGRTMLELIIRKLSVRM
jgi:hypothetical protein